MKASDALTQPGDAARRESDGAVLFAWQWSKGDLHCLLNLPERISYSSEPVSWFNANTGDDWQPLHPAGELAAEVKRLTAERDEARRERDSFREKRDAARAKGRLAAAQAVERDRAIDALTARVAELESGSAFVGDELRSRTERDEHYGFYWAQSSRGGPELELSHTDEAAIPECHDWMRAFAYTGPTTAPLPTAGEEGKSWAWSKEDSERRKKVEAWVEATDPDMIRRGLEDIEAGRVVPLEDVIAEEAPAPAEPDSSAEEHRKPDCLDGVPAVLCEHECRNERHWAYGPISDGWVAAWSVEPDGERHTCLLAAEFLTPIHHDPTDAAAEALRSEIEGGGSNG